MVAGLLHSVVAVRREEHILTIVDLFDVSKVMLVSSSWGAWMLMPWPWPTLIVGCCRIDHLEAGGAAGDVSLLTFFFDIADADL